MSINVLDGCEGSAGSSGAGAYGFGRCSDGGIGWSLGANVTTGYFGFHFIMGNFGNLWFVFGGEFTINYDFGSGSVRLYRGNRFNQDPGWTLLYTGTGYTYSSSTFHWAEGFYTAGDSGSVVMSIDGIQVLSLSGVDISVSGNNYVNSLYLGADGNNNASYDNIYHFDSLGLAPYNANIGEFRIQGLFPTGAGSSTQFTPSTGSNYTCVDEISANNDTDYVYSTTAVKKDLYTFGDVTGTPTAIYAVAVISRGRRDDTAPHTYVNVLKSGVVEVEGATRLTIPTYTEYRDYFTADPNTGLVWDVAKVNALEAGVKLKT